MNDNKAHLPGWIKSASVILFVLLLLILLLLLSRSLSFRTGAENDGSGDSGSELTDYVLGDICGEPMVNLAAEEGVVATADSLETVSFPASLAIDGDRESEDSRWSSANEPGNPSHWLCLEFPEDKTVSFLRIIWERRNVEAFVLETSSDGVSWEICYEQDTAPSVNDQAIVLDAPVQCRFLRLRTTKVSDSEENLFLYYQNVSLLELEVYGSVPLIYGLDDPVIRTASDGSRYLELPSVPDGYEIALAGADYEEVIGPDGTVYSTVAETTVELGYVITRTADGTSGETPAYRITVPASSDAALSALGIGEETAGAVLSSDNFSVNACPTLSVTPAEWLGLTGDLSLHGVSGLILSFSADTPEAWSRAAQAALSRIGESTGLQWAVYSGSGELLASSGLTPDASASDLSADLSPDASATALSSNLSPDASSDTASELSAGALESTGRSDNALCVNVSPAQDGLGLGEEGYLCGITEDGVTLLAQERSGLIWGLATLEELLESALAGEESALLPCGVLRDYPRYRIRGFSIDIGRRMVSLELLERIVDELAQYHMNSLGIHLNDNAVLATSGLNDSVENALGAYSGFRLESSLTNEDGISLTSEDGALSIAEWKALVAYGAARGVEVVPEIDMPAHSLAITRLFPELALTGDPESVDQLDLSRDGAGTLAEEIWREYLDGESAAFASNDTIHIGMDEYYGDEEDFLTFRERIVDLVRGYGHTVRMWGSCGLPGDLSTEVSRRIQVQIWSWEWADPVQTYEAGYTVINSMSNELYIVPGSGYDTLDPGDLSDWEPNRFTSAYETIELPSWSARMGGAIYCLWNDNYDLDITEDDLFDRFAQPLPLLSGKLW